MCKSWCETIIGIIILACTFWSDTIPYARWITIIAAIALIMHSCMCKKCLASAGHSGKK